LGRFVAEHRPEVSNQLKKKLRREAGDKCANPGCAATRTHLHHIREWAAYRTHDGRHMIAVCPTCHDAIHHGALPITDETVYAWKTIPRGGDEVRRGHLYVEPGARPKILLGSVAITGPEGVTAFQFGASQELSFRTSGADLLLLSLRLVDLAGEEILLIRDGHVVHKRRPGIEYAAVPGRIQVTAPADDSYVPEWALSQIRSSEPDFGRDGRITVAELEVMEPNLVRVEGVWMDDNTGVIITPVGASFLRKGEPRPLTLVGEGKNSTIDWRGPLTCALFDLLGRGPAQPRVAADRAAPGR
jgi:hypothetical protein